MGKVAISEIMDTKQRKFVSALARCIFVLLCQSLIVLCEACQRWASQYVEVPAHSIGPDAVETTSLEEVQHKAEEIPSAAGVKQQEHAVVKWKSQPPTNARKRYYAVAAGKKPGLFPSWFTAGAQVNGVSGAMQERFGTREEALKYIGSYFRLIGCTDDIIEYNEDEQEVCRYRSSEMVM